VTYLRRAAGKYLPSHLNASTLTSAVFASSNRKNTLLEKWATKSCVAKITSVANRGFIEAENFSEEIIKIAVSICKN
jgi:hypothetical protein